MNLEEFVSESLKQISKGIIEAQQGGVLLANIEHTSKDVDFDIAVTVSDSSETGGKAGISVWSIGAEAKAKKQTASNTVSRIRFSIPIFHPGVTRQVE